MDVCDVICTMRYTSLYILLCFLTLGANANQRMFEAVITVDSAGNAIKSKERLTVPDDWYIIEGLNGRALVRDRNKIYNVFSMGGRIHLRSTFDGINWSGIAPVNSNDYPTINYFEGKPYALGFAQKGVSRNVVVTWISKIDTTFYVVASVSSDSGKTFSSPVTIHKDINREYRYISVAQDQGGGLYCIWQNKYTDSKSLYLWTSKTTDGGITWSAPTPQMYDGGYSLNYFLSPDGASCQGNQLTVFAPGKDLNIYQVTSQGTTLKILSPPSDNIYYYRSTLVSDDLCNQHIFYSTRSTGNFQENYIYHRYSSNNGYSWSDASLITGFSMNGFQKPEDNRPTIAFTPSGKIYALISDDSQLLKLYHSTDKGTTWKSSDIMEDSTHDSDVAPSIVYIGSKDGIDSLLIVWEDYRELPTSVYSIKAVQFNARVYPNPAKEKIQIALELSEPQQLAFTITDVLGKKVYEQEPRQYGAGKETIELLIDRIQTSGIYLLRITTDKGEQTIQRIAVEK
jgi:hypothetical protein